MQRLPHDGVQVDEDAVAQEVVDLLLVDAVPRGDREQVRALVVGVVVDVQVGVDAAARVDVVDERDERVTLRREVVRPQGVERRPVLGVAGRSTHPNR